MDGSGPRLSRVSARAEPVSLGLRVRSRRAAGAAFGALRGFAVGLTLTVAVAITASMAVPARAQEVGASWTSAASMPTPRSELQAAVVDGVVFLPGGLGSDRALDTFEAYDPEHGRWEALPSLPRAVHHAGVAAAEGRVFVTGGYADLSFVPGSLAWAYDPSSRSWTRLPDLPGPRAGHALVPLNGVLHVIGGIGRTSQAVWRFDLDAGRWIEPGPPIPTVREHLTAVAAGGRIWAIGGRWPGEGEFGTVETYDPATGAWETAPSLPTPRSGLTSAVLAGAIHVLGGEALRGDRTFVEHEVYDLADGTWRSAAALVPGRHGLASAVVHGRLYVIGGATRAGGDTFTSLTGAVSVWGDR